MISTGFIPVDANGLNHKYLRMVKEGIDIDEIKLIQFFEKYVPEVLVCYAAAFGNTKKYETVNDKFSKIMSKTKLLFPTIDIRVDSAGFQVNVGVYNYEKTLELIRYYYDYLDNYLTYDKAFILDLCPSSNSIAFNNWDDVSRLNHYTYEKGSSININKNLIFIYQMYTVEIEKIWNELLNEHFNNFNYFSIGGVASNKNSSGNKAIGFTMAVYKTLKKTIESGRKELNFHFLGGKQYSYILIFELLRKHIKELYDIDFKYTFDSSGYALSISKFKTYEHFNTETNKILLFNLKLNNLDNIIVDGYSNKDLFLKLVNETAVEAGIDCKIKEINNAKGVFDFRTNFISNLLLITNYRKVQEFSRSKMDSIYYSYKTKDVEEFFNQVGDTFYALNVSGNRSRHQKRMVTDMFKALDLITRMDDDYYYYILNKTTTKLKEMDDSVLTF